MHVPMYSVLKKFTRIAEGEFILDSRAIGLDGLYAQMKFFGYVAWTTTLAKKGIDLKFPLTESIDKGVARQRFSINESFCEFRLKIQTQVNAALEHICDGFNYVFSRLGFHYVAAGAGTDYPFRIYPFFKFGKHKNFYFGIVRM